MVFSLGDAVKREARSVSLPKYYYLRIEDAGYAVYYTKDLEWGDAVSLGMLIAHYDAAQQTVKWNWVRNFRSSKHDSLQEAVDMVIIKHKMGAFDDENREIF